jgi:GTP pyrophosphokinase
MLLLQIYGQFPEGTVSDTVINALTSRTEAGSSGMLQLLAAWDRLAATLSPAAGTGPAAELLLSALKLALSHADRVNTPYILSRAGLLAELSVICPLLDAEAIAAGIISAVAPPPSDFSSSSLNTTNSNTANSTHSNSLHKVYDIIPAELIESRLGPITADLVAYTIKVAALPDRTDLLDDEAAAALRELALSFYDVRAVAIEIVARLDNLRHAMAHAGISYGEISPNNNNIMTSSQKTMCLMQPPTPELQAPALEALQLYAPMAHALGMSKIGSEIEDRCFRILFPDSYARTAAWLQDGKASCADTLEATRQTLETALMSNNQLVDLGVIITVQSRTKSLFSTLKKLLRLGNMSSGGRSRTEVFDLMGLRVIVEPGDKYRRGTDSNDSSKDDNSSDGNKNSSRVDEEACYIIKQVAQSLWGTVQGRSKDYIAHPKANGYQSLHETLLVPLLNSDDKKGERASNSGSDSNHIAAHVELQIRSQAMHNAAEMGAAAHGAYKGGLDASQARQLREWTRTLLDPTVELASASDREQTANSAAAALFRHLDTNQDGRVSLAELQSIVEELSVIQPPLSTGTGSYRGSLPAPQSASSSIQNNGKEEGKEVAYELLKAADSDGDGSLDLDEFMEFQKTVGLVVAASTFDKHVIHSWDQASISSASYNSGSDDGIANNSSSEEVESAVRQDEVRKGFPLSSPSSSSSNTPPPPPPGSSVIGNNNSYNALHVWKRAGSKNNSGKRSTAVGAYIENLGSPSSSSSEGGLGDGLHLPSSSSNGSSMRTIISSSDSTHNISLEKKPEVSEEQVVLENDSANGSNGTSPSLYSSSSHDSISGGTSGTNEAGRLTDSEDDDVVVRLMDGRDAVLATRWEALWKNIFQDDSSTPRFDSAWQLVPLPSNKHVVLDASGQPLPEKNEEGGGGDDDDDGEVLARFEKLAAAASYKKKVGVNSSGSGQSGTQRVVVEVTPAKQVVPIPFQGPCIIGAVQDNDCDIIISNAPTVSGRHARFEVIRSRSTNSSKCLLMDLGSTNGTFVNRSLRKPFVEVAVRPGDILWFAEAGISYQVRIVPPIKRQNYYQQQQQQQQQQQEEVEGSSADEQTTTLPKPQPSLSREIQPALRVAAVLEQNAAHRGIFAPPGEAATLTPADLCSRATDLLKSGDYDAAYTLLLGGAMQHPQDGSLWARLASVERHRARQKVPGSATSKACARVFFRAAASCYDALPSYTEEQTAEREALRARIYLSWGLLEWSLTNEYSARLLLQKSVRAGRRHPTDGPSLVPKTLFAWASREWKKRPKRGGDGSLARRLCGEALNVSPDNAYVLTLLGSIEVAVGSGGTMNMTKGRELFGRALAADPGYIVALQAWAYAEATASLTPEGGGSLTKARELFAQALKLEPENRFVLHAWGVAESRAGNYSKAKMLLQRCVKLEPKNKAAWHALGKLAAEHGQIEDARCLYLQILEELSPESVETMNALGCLERRAGNFIQAEDWLNKALDIMPDHAPSLKELAWVKEQQGKPNEAAVLMKQLARGGWKESQGVWKKSRREDRK